MRRFMLAALVVLSVSSPAGATLTAVSNFGSNPGALSMYEYIPAGLPAGRPLVVVLHGCSQTAAAMEAAGWNKLADQYQFAVLYPQQSSANNPVTCFNWAGEYGDPADLTRGQGENQSIMSMIDFEITSHGVDRTKVYIMGFSAGASFVEVMLATWPDRFVAGSVMEGSPYECATTVAGAYSCMSPGVDKTPAAWGDLVRAAFTMSGTRPRIQLWHGTSDNTVVMKNLNESLEQWTNVFGADMTADETESIGSAATRNAYKVGTNVVVETYTVQSLSHAVSIGNEGSVTCPSTTGSYFEAHGVCATLRAAKFFGVVPGGTGPGSGSGSSGVGAPFVSIVSPSNGEQVTGNLTIVVAAGDDVGVTSVELKIDGTSVGTDMEAPYQFPWDATAAGPGTHELVALASDGNNNVTTVTAMVTVPGPGGGGSGGSDDDGGGVSDLPACSLDAGKSDFRGWAPIAMAVVIVFRIGRRRRTKS